MKGKEKQGKIEQLQGVGEVTVERGRTVCVKGKKVWGKTGSTGVEKKKCPWKISGESFFGTRRGVGQWSGTGIFGVRDQKVMSGGGPGDGTKEKYIVIRGRKV